MSNAGLQSERIEEALISKLGMVPIYGVVTGADAVNYVPYTSNNYSNTSITYVVQPSDGMVVDRIMMQHWRLAWTIQGTSASGPLLAPGTGFGPRSWPAARCINNVQGSINSGGISVQYDQLGPWFAMKNLWQSDDIELTTFPSMADQFQQYYQWQTLGSTRNPLNLYGSSTMIDGVPSRGGFSGLSITSNPSGSGTLTATGFLDFYEPVILSPLEQKGMPAGFIGLRQLQMIVNISNLQRALSIDTNGPTANPISSVVVTFASAPILLTRELRPAIISPVPDTQMYEYNKLDRYYTNAIGTIAAGATLSNVQSITMVLQNIPSMILICARQQLQDQSYNTSDTFMAINAINISWQGNSGLLSNASQGELFKITRKNGCNQSWDQWSNYQGSVLALVPGVGKHFHFFTFTILIIIFDRFSNW